MIIVFLRFLLIAFPSPIENGLINPLEFHDFILERIQKDLGPALGSALDEASPWESYNQWNCFQPNSIEFTFSELHYDSWKTWPSIQVQLADRRLLFEPEVDLDIDPQEVLFQWKALLYSNSLYCVYSAYLQNLDSHNELHILESIKSLRGSWSINNCRACGLARNANSCF